MIEIGKQTIMLVEGSELQPNPWNPNSVGVENMEKLKASLQNNGFFKPVLVRELEDGTLEIIGGKHRVDAAMELGMAVPVVNLGAIDDVKAKKFTLMDNDGYGENDSILLSKVLSDLAASGEDILSEMTYSNEELSELVDLATRVDLDVLDELDDLDLDAPVELDKPKIDIESDSFKTVKVKVDIAVLEVFEDTLKAKAEDLELDDSDMAVVRGKVFQHLLLEAVDE